MKKRNFLFNIQTRECLSLKFLSVVILFALCIMVIGCATIPPGDYSANVDIDIDSDNNNAFGQPDRSTVEDEMEDHSNKSGRIVVKNDDDNDGDQISDFADGFNLDGVPDNEDDINPSQRFVPLILQIPRNIDLDKARIRIKYNASNPADVEILREEPLVYKPGPGTLRIWTRPGNLLRNPAKIAEGGDFVAPTEYIPAQLGLTNRTRSVTWYVEGIQTSRSLADQEIIVELDANGNRPARLDKDVVRLTIVDFQFKTQDLDGRLVDQEFTYNSVPAPQIKATVQECHIDEDGLVTMRINGTVSDQASGIVHDPHLQLRNITISPQNQTTHTIDLVNSAEPEYPWQPYKFQALFSATVQLQTRYDSGEYWVALKTSENLAGVASEQSLFVIRDGRRVHCMEGPEIDPGTYITTIMRVDAPEGTFRQGADTIYTFDSEWPLKYIDLGDGKYFYAMDSLDHVAVFLPALYAKGDCLHCPVKKIDKSLLAKIKIKGQDVTFRESYAVEGLIIDNDDITAHLSKITGYKEQVFNWGTVKKYVYRAGPTWPAGHLDNELDTEIKWRNINLGDTISDFKSKAEFLKDIDYRIAVVNSTKKVKFGFASPDFNPVYWEDYDVVNPATGEKITMKKVKAGKKASDAIFDIFTGSYQYKMHCLWGAMCVVENAAAQALGSITFDWSIGLYPFKNSWKVLKREVVKGSGPEKNAKWIPGDWGYIKNLDPTPLPTLEGENIIYIGGNWDLGVNAFGKNADFWGHGGGQKKFQDWVNMVDVWSTQHGVDILSHRDRLKQ